RAQKVLDLLRIFEQEGKVEEARKILRRGVELFPHNKQIRNYYREWVRTKLEKVFPKPGTIRDLTDSIVLELFETLFEVRLEDKTIKDLLSLDHPHFEFGNITTFREGEKFRLNFSIFDQKDESPAGKFQIALQMNPEGTDWQLQIISAEINEKFQQQSIS